MTFRFDKLTTKAQALVAEAQGRAASAGNPEINSLHLIGASRNRTRFAESVQCRRRGSGIVEG